MVGPAPERTGEQRSHPPPKCRLDVPSPSGRLLAINWHDLGMTIVLSPGESAVDLVAAANRSCPGCGGTLRRWGNARWRVVRESSGNRRFRPARVRCQGCGVTQVVLPADVLVRRRDAVVSVGFAWRLFAAGAGSRRTSRVLGLPVETVRGWLRRLAQLARTMFGASRGNDQERLDWALANVEAQAHTAGWRSEQQIWSFVAYRSQGLLLFNTSWP